MTVVYIAALLFFGFSIVICLLAGFGKLHEPYVSVLIYVAFVLTVLVFMGTADTFSLSPRHFRPL